MVKSPKDINLLLKVGQLCSFRVIPNLPKWYQAMQLVPPTLPPPRYVNKQDIQGTQPFERDLKEDQASHYQTQIQNLMKSSTTQTKNKQKKESHLRPKNIEFPEDILRRRFYEQFPFELLTPQQLAETDSIEADYATPLSKRKNVTGEDVIQHQLYLVSQGMTIDDAFNHVSREFVSIRLAQEEAKRIENEERLRQDRLNRSNDLSDTEKVMEDLKARYPKNFALWQEEEEHLLKNQTDAFRQS